MNRDLEEKLFNDFPHLYRRVPIPQESGMFWGFECGNGWYELIRELSEKLTKLIKKTIEEEPYNEEFPFDVVQVKEKYGTLRYYMSTSTDNMQDLIHEYEEQSAHTCDVCGLKGELSGKGWYAVRCKKHQGDVR